MTSKNASAASEPATSLTDKEREAIAQMPYEEARDKPSRPCRRWRPAD